MYTCVQFLVFAKCTFWVGYLVFLLRFFLQQVCYTTSLLSNLALADEVDKIIKFQNVF